MIKKILGLALTVCMLAQLLCVPAFAVSDGNFAEGDTVLFMPPEGKISALPLTISGESAALTVPANQNGVYKNAGSLILDGDTAAATTAEIAVSGTANGVSASKNVTVSNERLFWDFEDGTVGSTDASKAQKLDGTEGTVYTRSSLLSTSRAATIAGDETNKYLDCGDNDNKSGIWYFGEGDDALLKNSKTVTIEFDATLNANNYFLRIALDGSNGYFTLASNSSGTKWWWKSPSVTSAQQSSNTDVPKLNQKYHFTVTVDLEKAKLTMLIDGNAEFNAVNVGTLGADCYISGLVFNKANVDNLAVYSGAPYSATDAILGTTQILLSDSGYTKHGYEATGAQVAQSGVITGSKEYGSSLVIDNSASVSGTKNLTAIDSSDNTFVGKKTVSVSDILYYEDFEDAVSGAVASTAKLKKVDGTDADVSLFDTTSVLVANSETCGNYIDAHKDSGATVNLSAAGLKTGKVSIEMKVKGEYTRIVTLYNSSGAELGRVGLNTGLNIYSWNNPDGTWSSQATQNGSIPSGEWKNFKLVADIDKGEFSFSVDGEDIYAKDENGGGKVFKFKKETDTSIASVKVEIPADDIKIYTGETVTLMPDVVTLNVPAQGGKTQTVSASFSDSTMGTPNITSITTDNVNVTGDTTALNIDANVSLAKDVTVTVSDGFMSGSAKMPLLKDYVLMNGVLATDGTVLNAGAMSDITVTAAYGSSRLSGTNRIVIAKYTKDGVLEDVVLGDIGSNDLTASMTGIPIETDCVKVFVWSWNTLKPIKDSVFTLN